MVNGRAKGADGERELAGILERWGAQAGVKLELKRNLEQVRGGGHDLVGLEPYGLAVEVKRVEQLSLNAWWQQACRQARSIQCLPVLAWRQNRKPWAFRTRAWVYPCQQLLDVDMNEDGFRAWFQAHLERGQNDVLSQK